MRSRAREMAHFRHLKRLANRMQRISATNASGPQDVRKYMQANGRQNERTKGNFNIAVYGGNGESYRRGGDSADVEVLRSPSAIATIARLSRKRAQACRHFDVRSRRIISKLIGEVNERRTASYASHCYSRGM